MVKAASPIELDGRTLEGGGQLIRIALCLSALTSVPVRIANIRGNRSGGGGLKAQHLACVNWLAQACNARVEGAEKGAKTLLFVPGAARSAGEIDVLNLPPVFRKKALKNGSRIWDARLDIGTAGSTGLALQAILPFVLFTKLPGSEENGIPIRLTLSGGTNVSGSPSYDYITQVLLPTLENIGFPGITATLAKRGWSHGGTSIGEFTLEIPATTRLPLPPFHLTRQDPPTKRRTAPCSLTATVIAPAAYHDHFRDRLTTAIAMHFNLNNHASDFPLKVQCEDSHHDKRLYLLLVAQIPVHKHQPDVTSDSSSTCTPSATHHFLGRDWLYDRKLPPNGHPKAIADMAGRVVRELHREVSSGACVDEHLRDQMVDFQALAKGRSVVFAGEEEDEDAEGLKPREPSLHARTAEWVCREMLGVRFDAGGVCEGIGYGGDGADDGGGEGMRPGDLVERTAELGLGDSGDRIS
ncbi:hypothetical protein LTR91_022345 [Friedmanniomyces endolithicus]|uniref:RNA 3'-terminal phosphate cyclase domain-containing protein n=1 Tax=Friedmanniomyces endolithicus TaxID=329885 RepID=A0AAN6H472_9PEZI|nr:hypothetical protein LTR59_010246 [Friedmanniomyces endolithicus]KAK0802437.1 hypothetical protein LTR38_006481 [Friedmanniomyces endolithicus]KAK0817971.1 hypothetical protein LTR75_002900 [Friedmanniomyces endolithicus]KAK0844268.1 hypothetical protein LTR03_008135 [Friedmanniomyces endolithicus]KAK0859692.1 hypothetical protein LTS02_009034 [Friedmanniomyces endolithicus]